MKTSPTQRTLAVLRDQGYIAEVVERWNQFSKTRKDLFGIIDVLAIGNGETVAVQTTSASNISKRMHKMEESPCLAYMRDAGWKIHIHGWKKDSKGHWVCRTVDIS